MHNIQFKISRRMKERLFQILNTSIEYLKLISNWDKRELVGQAKQKKRHYIFDE